MAKDFLIRIIFTLLVFGLLSGIITAGDNTAHSLTGRQTEKIYYDDIENFINEKILNRK